MWPVRAALQAVKGTWSAHSASSRVHSIRWFRFWMQVGWYVHQFSRWFSKGLYCSLPPSSDGPIMYANVALPLKRCSVLLATPFTAPIRCRLGSCVWMHNFYFGLLKIWQSRGTASAVFIFASPEKIIMSVLDSGERVPFWLLLLLLLWPSVLHIQPLCMHEKQGFNV